MATKPPTSYEIYLTPIWDRRQDLRQPLGKAYCIHCFFVGVQLGWTAENHGCNMPTNRRKLGPRPTDHGYLVGGWATPLKNLKVNWDDDIPNMNGKMPKMATKPPTRYGLVIYKEWDTNRITMIYWWIYPSGNQTTNQLYIHLSSGTAATRFIRSPRVWISTEPTQHFHLHPVADARDGSVEELE